MTAVKCACGQTYGTCQRHPGPAPAIASYLFIRHDGTEFHTFITRPRWMTDEVWEEAQLFSANNIGEKLVDDPKKQKAA